LRRLVVLNNEVFFDSLFKDGYNMEDENIKLFSREVYTTTMNNFTLIQKIVIWAIPILFAITVHEVAHGWVANKLGDPTAKMLGRLTLNPIKHIDPIGTLLVPAILIYFGGFIFGWAKPVPITWQNLKNPKRDMIYVAAAGPGANFVMALIWALIAKIAVMMWQPGSSIGLAIVYMGSAGIMINLLLMVLNLIPIPPLDGGRVLSGLLPGKWSVKLDRIEPFGFLIILALLMTGVLGTIIGPVINALRLLIFTLFGLGQ